MNWIKRQWNKVKEFFTFLRRKAVRVLIGGAIASAAALVVPIIPQDTQWVVSYETLAFETENGELGINEYALVGQSQGWYVRTIPKENGQFEVTENPVDIQGKKLVDVRCEKCAYYDEFVGKNGEKVRILSDKNTYDGLRYIENYPQPRHEERVAILTLYESNAAIAYDNDTIDESANVSSVSFAHTSTGSDLVLMVGSYLFDGSINDRNITNVTYNSVTATTIRRDDASCCFIMIEIWYLEDPATGSNTVVITFAGTIVEADSIAMTITGADTLDANNGTTVQNVTSVSTIVTTVADNSWVLDMVYVRKSNTTLVVGAGQTQRDNHITANGIAGASTEGPKTPAGGVTMSWSCTGGNCTGSEDWVLSAASFSPVAAAPASKPGSGSTGTQMY